MDVLKKLLTAVRGGARELGEALVENQSERIFEQELIEAEKSLRLAKQALTDVMAKDMLAQRERKQMVIDLTALEQQVTHAIGSGEQSQAEHMAKRVLGMQAELERMALHQQALALQTIELRELVEHSERQWREHQRQLSMLRTTEQVHQVTQAVHERFDASVLSTESALQRIKRKRAAVADRIDVEQAVRELGRAKIPEQSDQAQAEAEQVTATLKRLSPVNRGNHDQG